MTRVDDLRRGDYVCIVRNTPMETQASQDVYVQYAGTPYHIKAISLPFVAVRDPNDQLVAFDTRVLTLQKVTKQYAKLFQSPKRCPKCKTDMMTVRYCGKCHTRRDS